MQGAPDPWAVGTWNPTATNGCGSGWWRCHWEITGKARVLHAWEQDDGWRHWQNWCEVCAQAAEDEVVRGASRGEARMPMPGGRSRSRWLWRS
jgi:hypothetical protein